MTPKYTLETQQEEQEEREERRTEDLEEELVGPSARRRPACLDLG